MRVSDGTWDVRCPETLRELFPKRSGYYFRVDAETAGRALQFLSEAYGIPPPALGRLPAGSRENAVYERGSATVLLRARSHLRTVFHEFYHHLDRMTGGRYDSDDRQGGPSSLAWMFADRLWEEFSGTRPKTRTKRGAA